MDLRPVFPLFTKTFPDSPDQLAELLRATLRRLFILQGDPVAVRAFKFPRIEELAITLDGAQVRPDPPRPVFAQREGSEALDVQRFSMSGKAIELAGGRVNLRLDADAVRFKAGTAPDGDIVLVLGAAENGRLEASVGRRDLETVIAELAKGEAAKQGVAVESVALNVKQHGARSIAAEVRLRARKLFLSATLQIDGELDIDERFNATISGLKCTGSGALGTLACGVLGPHLERLNQRSFSLLALPLGEIQIREIQLTAGETIAVNASFQSVA